MEITSRLLGARDMLEMNMISAEYVMPSIRDCYSSMQRYPSYPPSFEGMKLLETWHKKLSTMKATDALTEDEVKQLKFDLGKIYDEFGTII